MALAGRFFFYNLVLVVLFASIGAGSIIEFARFLPMKVVRSVIKVGITVALFFFLVLSPLKESLFPIFPRLKNRQTVRKNVEEAVSIIKADKDFREDSFLVVPAEHEGRICVLISNKGSHVYPIRQLAALEEIPMFEKNIFYLMHLMAKNRAGYVYQLIL